MPFETVLIALSTAACYVLLWKTETAAVAVNVFHDGVTVSSVNCYLPH